MKYLIHTILFISVSVAIDILSIQLPENVKSLYYNGYSIASKDNYAINPSSLSSCKDSYFEFSNNQWLFDISGSYFSYINNNLMFSSYHWGVDGIDFYDDVPSSSPLYTFGSKTYFLGLAQGFSDKSNNHHFGYSVKYSYMKLLEYENKGLVLDLGYRFDLSPISSFALAINNINTGFKDHDQLPQIAVVGASQKIKNIPITLNFDIFFEYQKSEYEHKKGSGSYQGIAYNNQYFDFIMSHCYYSESDESDIALGLKFLWKNLGFSVSTLIKENDSIGSPVFYQLSYHF
tara:strand:+ start:1141 stop:2007 length:867 start_codon:yes stop_codon:yes gene_type:complete